MAARFLYLMDPVERIDIDADSSFVLMLESQRRGHEVLYAHPRALELRAGQAWVTAFPIQLRRKKGDHFTLGAPVELALNDTHAVFMRKDPPFDIDFLVSTYLLDRVDRARVVMFNEPQALYGMNEKLSALRWPHLGPATLITADRAHARRFIQEHGRAVVKPLMMAGGSGVLLLQDGDRNTGSALDLLTGEGARLIVVQAYVEAVEEGDKRIILLNGAPIGALNRRPQKNDLRANMHVGGTAEASKLTDREREICAEIGPELARRGVIFAGIDVIGGYLTEVNITSPTGLQEIDRFDGVCLEAQFIDFVEQRIEQLGRSV